MDPVTVDVLSTIIAALLLTVAVIGTIYPVLPGSLLTVATLIGWAWILGSTPAWSAAVAGVIFALIGMSASFILTGRTMKREKIPSLPVTVGVVAGIVGMFIVPGFGLFIGVALGLFTAELVRQRQLKLAVHSSLEALKSLGLGLLIEFAGAALAASTFAMGAFLHFA